MFAIHSLIFFAFAFDWCEYALTVTDHVHIHVRQTSQYNPLSHYAHSSLLLYS